MYKGYIVGLALLAFYSIKNSYYHQQQHHSNLFQPFLNNLLFYPLSFIPQPKLGQFPVGENLVYLCPRIGFSIPIKSTKPRDKPKDHLLFSGVLPPMSAVWGLIDFGTSQIIYYYFYQLNLLIWLKICPPYTVGFSNSNEEFWLEKGEKIKVFKKNLVLWRK